MKAKIVSAFFIFFLTVCCLQGQTISYTYDDNGNRTSRIYVEPLQRNSVQFPVLNQKDLQQEAVKQKVIEGELGVNVYPNPTRGILKVDISYMPTDSKTEARIYDLNGTEQLFKKNFDSFTEVDISRLKDGIYILRIRINGNIFDWKVIKNNR